MEQKYLEETENDLENKASHRETEKFRIVFMCF